MFVHRIGYRHANGDIEGFAGAGLTPAAARQNGFFHAKHAIATVRREAFVRTRIIDDLAQLDAAEHARVAATIPALTFASALL